MKKFLIIFVSILTTFFSIFGTNVKADSEYSLTLDSPVNVSVDVGEVAICTFTPSESNFYRFYSTGSFDTVASLYDDRNNELGYGDDIDGEHNRNFQITLFLLADKTYYLEARLYSYLHNPGNFQVAVEKTDAPYAMAEQTLYYTDYKKPLTLRIVGTCLNDPYVTYTWYKITFNYDTAQSTLTKLSTTGPEHSISKLTKSGLYRCVVNENESDYKVIDIEVIVDNGFHLDYKNSNVKFVYGNSKAKLEAVAHGNTLTDATYTWYRIVQGEPLNTKVATTNTPVYSSATSNEDTTQYKLLGQDKYGNVDTLFFYVVRVDRCLFVNDPVSISNDKGDSVYKTFLFTPTETGTYTFSSNSMSGYDPSVSIMTEDATEIASDDDSGQNFDFYVEVELEKGRIYYVDVYLRAHTYDVIISVDGPTNNLIISAGNTGAGIDVGWAKDEAGSKYKLYRRLKGSSSWTEVGSTTATIYSDNSSLKMGKTYEYTVKSLHGSSWVSLGQIAEVVRNPFIDVSTEDSYFNAVAWAKNSGVVNGIDSTHFGPTDPVQRQHFTIMLWRFAGKPSSTGKNKFVDIGSCNATAKKSILWASGKGIIKGTKEGGKTYFKPFDYISREQILIMLHRFAGSPKVTEAQIENLYSTCNDNFAEMELGQASVNAMAWALAKGVYEPDPNDEGYVFIRPKDYCSRAELCIFLKNFNTKVKKYK